jgi:SNF2 family DNA or RNA helicase
LTPDVNLLEDLKRHSFYKNGDSGDSLGPLFTGLSRFQLTDLQASDLARINGRDYPYLAWEPGTGKTAVSYLWAKRKKTRYLFIVSTDLSIRGTWQTFLPLQGETYQLLDAFKDVANLKPGIILLTFDRMRVLYPYLKRFLRGLGKHSTIIFDEGDELINVGTERTQTALALFRRFRYKLVATGTPTRNSIQELYPQLELLFNNSTLMCNDAEFLYHVDEKSGETERIVNDERGVPFRARSGYKDFCETFSPKKVTVFGINKDTQDVYNMKYLTPLLSRFRITRTFDEVVGDGKYVYHQHALPMSSGEAALQEKLIKEFYSFKNYFQDTGNSRKEAGLRALRQLMLLKNMTSFGHLYPDATYSTSTKLEHAVKLVERTPDLVAIGLTRKIVDGANYLVHWREQLEHLGRPFFLVDGDMSALERKRLTDEFQKSGNGILIATQTALPASLNIPACNTVIVPEWPWNWPRIRQFIGRFIRFDSTDQTNVHFLLLDRSIDINLWNLIVNKEHLNNIVKHGREANNETLCEMFGLDSEILNMVMAKELDHEGKVSINWTQQTM